MSWEAIAWVLEDAPDLPPHLVGTLLGIATHANESGCGSFPSQKTIAWYARKSDRAVRNDLVQLQKLGLIREGNQLLAAHIPADERPTVWELAMDRRRAPRPQLERKWASGPSGGSGSGLPVPRPDGAEVGFRSPDQGSGSGLPPETEGAEVGFRPLGGGSGSGLPTNQKRKKTSSSPFPIARIADALSIEEEEARQIYDRVIAERNPKAPSRYIGALISSGDITQYRPIKKVPAQAVPTHRFDDDGTGHCRTCRLPETHARHGGRP